MNASSFVSPPQLLALARELELPSCVCEQLVQTAVPALLDACAAQCMALTAPDTAFPAWKHLEAQFSGRDPDGMQILALYLAAACRTREKYRMMCIPDEIFRDTMGCFSRFLREAKARSGRFIFDRAFWAWRHLACRLFRLGTLEFEYRAAGADEPLPSGIGPGTPVLSVHIPSDARLSDDALPGSYGQADEFLLCTARHCVKAACPALCCAALGCSRPRCVRCCPRTPAFPVLAGIITSTRPTLTANLFISGCSAAKSPLLCFPGKPAYSEPWRHTWSKAGISGPATESKSKTNLLAHFLLQSSRASLADVRLFFYIFAAPASAQEKRTEPERQHCCSYPVAPSAAMSSCRSVMASPLLAKHMDVNGVPPAAWGHTPAVWSTK